MEKQELKLPYISKPNEISNNDYHNSEKYLDYVSSTTIKLMQISPKWMKYCMDHPEDSRISTEADLTGSVYHSMLSSMANCGKLSEFENEYAIFEPPINPKTGKAYGYETNKFKEAYDICIAENPGKEICSQKEVNLANVMIHELTKGNDLISKDVNFLIKHGKGEISHFVEYEGGKFKYRTDIKTSTKIVDWKTCRHGRAKKEEFSKQILDLGYHISAAFYQYFDFIATGKWRTFYWVVQEKEPPYDFNIIDASNWAWEIGSDGIIIPHLGAEIVIRLIDQYNICVENNSYPGYAIFTNPDWRGHRIAVSEIPGWAHKYSLNFFN